MRTLVNSWGGVQDVHCEGDRIDFFVYDGRTRARKIIRTVVLELVTEDEYGRDAFEEEWAEFREPKKV